jgi:dolichol-phosphate mannosyltransferase
LDFRVLVVDDDSPDGTAGIVEEYIGSGNRFVVLIVRRGKRGLGSAVRDGMRYILENDPDAEYIVTMDADFSHQPSDLPKLLEYAREADLVQGSRYVDGGRIIGWGLYRRLVSWGANMIVRILYRTGIRDHTGNYRVYSRRVAEDMVRLTRYNGYEWVVEALLVALARGYRVVEAPITFINREKGSSKLGMGDLLKWLWALIRFRRRYSQLRRGAY